MGESRTVCKKGNLLQNLRTELTGTEVWGGSETLIQLLGAQRFTPLALGTTGAQALLGRGPPCDQLAP